MAIKNVFNHPYLRLIGSSASVVVGVIISAITNDPVYAQSGAAVAATGHAADFVKSLGQGIIASDLYQAFTQQSPAARDLLENHDLRRLVGRAIAECVNNAIKNSNKAQTDWPLGMGSSQPFPCFRLAAR